MDKSKLFKKWEAMRELLGTEQMLSELYSAMSFDEAKENLEHIDRMHDLNLFNETNEE